jgi:Carboxypeptidase regulatory-like domain
MRLRPIKVLLLAALFVAASPANKLNAQTTTSGGLTGVVTDPSHALVPDAGVEIRDSAKGTTQSTKTDREGVYRFFFLAPERYTLTVEHAGFRKESRMANVLLGPPVTVNVTLELATEHATVNVTGEAPLIQSENGDVSTTINRQQVAEVPNPGGDITYVAQIAPGAVMNTDQSGLANFSILGMPGTSNLFFLDGMSENDNGLNLNLAGSLNMLLGQNQIQEATVVSTGYSGQFGGAAGATINFITKSGSNQFHGNAQYYWNGRMFNANDWFNNANGQGRTFDIANQWAGSLGGPIQKDKLFFFFDSEGTRLRLSQNFFVVIPSSQFEVATIANIDSRFGSTSASDAFYKKIFALYNGARGASSAAPGSFTDPLGCTGFHDQITGLGITVPCAAHFFTTRAQPTSDTLTSGRVDWNASSNDRAFLRVQYDSGHNAIVVDPINPVFDAFGHNPWWQGQLMETHSFGSSAASQFLVGGYYLGPIFQVQNPSQTFSAFPNYLNFGVSNTFTNLGDGLAFPGGRPTTQFQISEDGVKTWRNQKFGFGVNFERIYWTTLVNTNLLGVLTPQTLDAFYQGGVDPGVSVGTDSNPDYTELLQGFTSHTSQRISFYTLGLYGQDEWHARSNLTITLALRAEHRSDPVCKQSCFARLAGNFGSLSHDPGQPYNQAILANQKQAFAELENILWTPRFSFAWQPFGVSHNSVIRGGIGIFYDPVSGNHTLTLSSNPPIFNIYPVFDGNLAPGERTSLSKDATASNAAFLNGFASGQTLAQIQAASPSFTPPGITNPATQMRAPQYQRWSLEIQQAFDASTSIDVGYYGNHGIRELVQNPDANAYGFGSLPTGICTNPPVPPCADPRFTGITQLTTNGVSNYNSMVASFRHRFSRWTQGFFQLNYTYSHTFDEVSNGGLYSFTFGSSIYPQDPNNLRGSYGPAEYDVRHSLNANYVWEVPVKAALAGRGPNRLVSGWQISGTIFARTGFPYTVIDNAEGSALNANNFFGTIYAVPVAPLGSSASCGAGAAYPPGLHPCQPPQLLADQVTPNPDALFVQTGCETGFNTGHLLPSGSCSNGPVVSFAQGRNHFRGPGYFNTDFTIMKNTKLRENATLGIGFQFFNFLNHPNFGFPDNYSSDQTFGQILYLEQSPTSIVGSGIGGDAAPRMIQLKAQIQF